MLRLGAHKLVVNTSRKKESYSPIKTTFNNNQWGGLGAAKPRDSLKAADFLATSELHTRPMEKHMKSHGDLPWVPLKDCNSLKRQESKDFLQMPASGCL